MQITTCDTDSLICEIVTDYRLNANHNWEKIAVLHKGIVTDYRLNANHNYMITIPFFMKL